MRSAYSVAVPVPSGISCTYSGSLFVSSKGGAKVEKLISLPRATVSISGHEVTITCSKANKKDIAMIHAAVAHIKNMFAGLTEKYLYELEICNVHFPMTVKVEGNKLVITNFLGEKVSRSAPILEGVEVKVAGTKVSVSSADIERAGQTAANIERASKVTQKDRRIFQDGIFITRKPEAIK
jgi:large subunit ribosomal protein L6